MEKSSSKPSFFTMPSPLRSNLKSSSAKTRSLCWQKSVKEENANWTTVDKPESTTEDLRCKRFGKRRMSAPCAVPLDFKSRKPSLKSIQMMKNGSDEVPSVSIHVIQYYTIWCFQIMNVFKHWDSVDNIKDQTIIMNCKPSSHYFITLITYPNFSYNIKLIFIWVYGMSELVCSY